MSKHTPGPWFRYPADALTSDSREFVQWSEYRISAGSSDAESDRYYRICSVSNVNNSPQNEANARLIAAAPELLEALNKVNEWCCFASEEDTSARLMALQQIGVTARAAIAKATGGTE